MKTRSHQHWPSGKRIKEWRADVAQLASSQGGQTRTKNKGGWLGLPRCSVKSGDEHKKLETFLWVVVMGSTLRVATEHFGPLSVREDRHMMLHSKQSIGTERSTEVVETTHFHKGTFLYVRQQRSCTVKCSSVPILQNSGAMVDFRSAMCKVTVPRKSHKFRQTRQVLMRW